MELNSGVNRAVATAFSVGAFGRLSTLRPPGLLKTLSGLPQAQLIRSLLDRTLGLLLELVRVLLVSLLLAAAPLRLRLPSHAATAATAKASAATRAPISHTQLCQSRREAQLAAAGEAPREHEGGSAVGGAPERLRILAAAEGYGERISRPRRRASPPHQQRGERPAPPPRCCAAPLAALAAAPPSPPAPWGSVAAGCAALRLWRAHHSSLSARASSCRSYSSELNEPRKSMPLNLCTDAGVRRPEASGALGARPARPVSERAQQRAGGEAEAARVAGLAPGPESVHPVDTPWTCPVDMSWALWIDCGGVSGASRRRSGQTTR